MTYSSIIIILTSVSITLLLFALISSLTSWLSSWEYYKDNHSYIIKAIADINCRIDLLEKKRRKK